MAIILILQSFVCGRMKTACSLHNIVIHRWTRRGTTEMSIMKQWKCCRKGEVESDNGLKRMIQWRNIIAFWLLGLCINYAYYIMLSAAHDILDHPSNQLNDTGNSTLNQSEALPANVRDCNHVSTGMILMASVIPSLLVKLISPFITSYITLQMIVVVTMNIGSFILVSFADQIWMTYTGVVLASISGGLGEVTLLKLQTSYDKNALSAFSSGTGFSGFVGSFSYAGITSSGLTPRNTLLVMVTFPFIMALTYFVILTPPNKAEETEANAVEPSTVSPPATEAELQTLSHRIQLLKGLFPKYILPLTAVYFCQYFINQGLFELMYFKGIWLKHEEQYRWLITFQVIYQFGVFISKSSVNLVLFDRLWILAIFQVLNTVLCICESYWLFLPTIWIVFVVILWEGLVGGSTYVSTYFKISQQVEATNRHFAIGVTSFWETLGVVVASFLAIPVHQYFCRLPAQPA